MTRKIILAIIHTADADDVINALVEKQHSVTRFSSMGGFLRRGSITLLVNTNEAGLEEALATIRETCNGKPHPNEHRATLFVLNAGTFEAF